MKKNIKLLFIAFLFFPFIVFLSSCDSQPKNQKQKTQTFITKKMPAQVQEPADIKEAEPEAVKEPADNGTKNVIAEKTDDKNSADNVTDKTSDNTSDNNSDNNSDNTMVKSRPDIAAEKNNNQKPEINKTAEKPPESTKNTIVTAKPANSVKPETPNVTATKADNKANLSEKPKTDNKKPGDDKTTTLTNKSLKDEINKDKITPYYSSEGKLDPFISPIAKATKKETTKKGKKKRITRKLTPLEKLDLSQIKLVAVITMKSRKRNVAMVQESSGKGYMVKVGTYIGTNSGRIIKIQNDRIIIKEQIRNFNGVLEDQLKTMKLQKKDNG